MIDILWRRPRTDRPLSLADMGLAGNQEESPVDQEQIQEEFGLFVTADENGDAIHVSASPARNLNGATVYKNEGPGTGVHNVRLIELADDARVELDVKRGEKAVLRPYGSSRFGEEIVILFHEDV